MKTKKLQTNQDVEEIVFSVIKNLNLELVSFENNVFQIKSPAGWFKWIIKIVIKVETLKNGFIVFEVTSSTLLGNLFSQKSDLEKAIIVEILNEIKK